MTITPLAACRRLARALARRSLGLSASGVFAPAWADPNLLHSISLPLPGGVSRDAPVLAVALRDGMTGRVLPRHWQPLPHGPIFKIAAVRAPRLHAQSAPCVVRERAPCSSGTATALVRDCLAPDRNYVLTCGHVVAPDRQTQYRDTARIGGGGIGYLAEWQPSIGEHVYRTGLDAALLEVTREDAIDLRALPDFLPAAVGSRLIRDLPVSLRRSNGPLSGTLKIYWSGYVDIPGVTPGYPDYFLTDAVGYSTVDATAGGDSGAAVWDATDSLMGMHVGALPDAVAGAANAVLIPIEPVLEWFAVQPYTRTDAASLWVPPLIGRRDGSVVPSSLDDDGQVSIVACTLWGEARGEGEQGMRAVGSVIANRVRLGWRGDTTAAAVCLAYKQFSCWNADDPNRPSLDRIARAPDSAYMTAATIAREVVSRTLSDITFGATHYIASTLRRRPQWLDGKQPCVVIGRHEFYKDIS